MEHGGKGGWEQGLIGDTVLPKRYKTAWFGRIRWSSVLEKQILSQKVEKAKEGAWFMNDPLQKLYR